MSSKAFLVLGLLVAAFVPLLPTKVAARDLADTSNDEKKNSEIAGETNGIDDAKQGVGGGYPGYGFGGYPGSGYGGYPGRGGYGGGYCRYGCCGRGYYGRGCRCCSYANQGLNAQTEAKPQN